MQSRIFEFHSLDYNSVVTSCTRLKTAIFILKMVEEVTVIVSWKRFIEPIIFLIQFSYAIADVVMTDMLLYKRCIQILENNVSYCDILIENSSSDAAKDLQNKIQPHIGTMLSLKSNIETFFPTLLMLFLGPWSDKNGRKPFLIFPFIGAIIYYSSYSILSQFNFNIYYFLIPSLVSSIMGGFPSILMTSFSYVTDTTEEKKRVWRLGLLDVILFGGQLVGFILNPIILKYFGYYVVFALAAVSCFIGFFYSIFCLDESIRIRTDQRESITTIFNLSSVIDLLKTVFKKRKNFDRCLMWCCLLIIALHDDMMQGTATILYLFSKRFGWSVSDFSNYSVFQLIVTMLGLMLLIKIIAPILRLSETSSIMIASLSNGSGSLIKAFAQRSEHLYISTGVGLFQLAPASLVRSIISKIVCKKDVGKAFAATTIMEKIGPLLMTPLFVYLHTNYLTNYPCPVWFLPAGLSFIIVVLTIIVRRRWKKFDGENIN